MDTRKSQLRLAMDRVRARTLWLLDKVPQEFLNVRVHDFYSPIGWHFGHVGRTEEYWICHKAFKETVLNDHLSFLFADTPDNPKDNRVNLPSREEIEEYLRATRSRALSALESAVLSDADPFTRDGYAWEFAIQHECQHQETICEMLQLIQKQISHDETPPVSDWGEATDIEFASLPGGTYTMGTSEHCVYDNERLEHMCSVDAFKLAKRQVTANQYLQFMRSGGYEKPSLWSEEGWSWRCKEGADRPEYWLPCKDGYAAYGPLGVRAIHPNEPVSSLSWYEAEAFVKWYGKRLPTESEWEYAASVDPHCDRKQRFPMGNQEPVSGDAVFQIDTWCAQPHDNANPRGASAFGMQDIAGNVWEWTSSKFLPYPGFEAFPYDGYSKDHMLGLHYCCRGGSWATAAPILRCTFRNWYVPTYRQGFLGLRCADD